MLLTADWMLGVARRPRAMMGSLLTRFRLNAPACPGVCLHNFFVSGDRDYISLRMGHVIAAAGLMLTAVASPAATLIYNVAGYTLDGPAASSFYALEYEDGLVTALYKDSAAAKASRARTRVNGKGLSLLPGLIDSHGHVTALGADFDAVNLRESLSEAEAVALVEAAAEPESDEWLVGRGWNEALWPSGELPGGQLLSVAVPDQPVALWRVQGDALWVNDEALSAAGIDESTTNPEGGLIVRDNEGAATGVLIGYATRLVTEAMPTPTLFKKRTYIMRALEHLASLGITSVHDAGVSALEMDAYESLLADGELPIRVYAMLSMADKDIGRKLELGAWEDEARSFTARSVMIWVDGSLGLRRAALHADYSDASGTSGALRQDEDTLSELMLASLNLGFQVNVGARGDRAATLALDNFEALSVDKESRLRRHRIEHASLLKTADIGRSRDLGVVASVLPSRASAESGVVEARLGRSRLERAYPLNELLDKGVRLAGGSGFPAEHASPFHGLHAAVTGTGRDGQPFAGWTPKDQFTREQALALYTTGAAYASHAEDFVGRLSPGYAADFILVRDDFFKVPARNIWSNKVIATVVAGQVIYADDSSPLKN